MLSDKNGFMKFEKKKRFTASFYDNVGDNCNVNISGDDKMITILFLPNFSMDL
jgi:hypothetical protein